MVNGKMAADLKDLTHPGGVDCLSSTFGQQQLITNDDGLSGWHAEGSERLRYLLTLNLRSPSSPVVRRPSCPACQDLWSTTPFHHRHQRLYDPGDPGRPASCTGDRRQFSVKVSDVAVCVDAFERLEQDLTGWRGSLRTIATRLIPDAHGHAQHRHGGSDGHLRSGAGGRAAKRPPRAEESVGVAKRGKSAADRKNARSGIGVTYPHGLHLSGPGSGSGDPLAYCPMMRSSRSVSGCRRRGGRLAPGDRRNGSGLVDARFLRPTEG